ncbi:MAG: hypothetical protein G01um101444_323 [Parcubacteria group bacterium Gr01-1014_44]|nr:MAG: hypothetical protein G01um101444_323 [Parcubacteria group bacterium Gr01-1014_44]
MSLSQLERCAFPEHSISLNELVEFADTREIEEPTLPLSMVAAHIKECKFCQDQLELLKQSDPILNGEDEKKPKVLIIR